MENDAPKRWCPKCKDHVDVKGKQKNQCVKCGSYTKTYKPGEEPEGEGKKQKEPKGLATSRPASLSAADLAAAEMLIKMGAAPNFNRLISLGINNLYERYMGGKKMDDQNQNKSNPKEAMKDLQERDIFQAYASNLKGQQESNPTKTMNELMNQKMLQSYIDNMDKDKEGKGNSDPFQQIMMMKFLQGGNEKNEGADMGKIMNIMLIKSLMGGGNENSSMQKEVADLKSQLQTQQLLSQNKNNNNNDFTKQFEQLEKIRADRDKQIKEAESKAQQSQQEAFQTVLNSRLQQLEQQIQQAQESGSTSKRMGDLKDEIEGIKSVQGMLGNKEKSGNEIAGEQFGKFAEALPSLIELGKQRKQQKQTQNFGPPEPQTPQTSQTPQPETPQPPAPEPQTPQSPKGLSSSEKEMSDTMSDMYIKKNE